MAILKINNASLYYEMHGSGESLILIPGYTSDHQTWIPLLDGLVKEFQVILVDNRGCGLTTDDNLPLSANVLADDVVALIDYLTLIKPHIVGHSMGGTVAQVIASTYPDKIGKLGILTSSAKWRHAMLLGLKSLLMMREHNIEFDSIFTATLAWIFGEAFLRDKKNIANLKRMLLNDPQPQSLYDQTRQYHVLEVFDGTAELTRIIAPTLIVYGTQDLLTLPAESEYMASQIPESMLIGYDCGHAVTLEQPQQLLQDLIKFLKLKA
jgi:3-oxoadipate enol-lactonase